MIENKHLRNYALKDINNIKVLGRTTDCREPLTLFWTASGIELNVKGSELWIEVEVDYNQYESWISVLLNDTNVSRQMLTAGRYWVCVFRGLNPEVVKNIKILKDVQPMPADSACCLQLHSIRFDGEFLPVPEKPYKIEFVGDSITSGEGLIGSTKEEDWAPILFGAVNNYASLTGNSLEAEIRIISQCGWGVYCGWDNNPFTNIPSIYSKVCGPLSGKQNEDLGALEDYPFTNWQPDVIVVNLGTNDNSSFTTPEWKDETTGKTYKLRKNEDDTLNEDDAILIQTSITNFLELLRKYNKNAHILWAYGALNIDLIPSIMNGINAYKEKNKDNKVSFIQFPLMPDEMIGARFHPGVLYHQEMAKCLIEPIKNILRNK